MEDIDTADLNFEGEKICLQDITMDQNIIKDQNITKEGPKYHHYSELEGEDRCPSLVELSLIHI